MNAAEQTKYQVACTKSDLIAQSGVCVLIEDTQIALFYLPQETPQVYALSNWDPIGKANVMSRGIIGDIDGELVVASPLYKQHFSLTDGLCLEDSDASLESYEVSLQGDNVLISLK